MKYLVFFSLLVLVLSKVSPTYKKKSSLQFSLNEEQKKTSELILPVKSNSFAKQDMRLTLSKYILERAKTTYDIVLLLSVEDRCPRCLQEPQLRRVMEDYVNDIAYSYNYENALKASSDQRQLFFMKVHYSKETHQIFRKLEINDVPRLIYFAAKDSISELSEQKKILSFRDKSGLNDILDFINRFSGRSVSYHEPLSKYMTTQLTLLGVNVGGIFTLRYTYQMILEPKVWLVLSLTAFVLCVGGSVHNIIHDVPWWKLERAPDGQIYIAQYIHKDSRMQWAGQGYMMSMLSKTSLTVVVIASVIMMLFLAVSKIQANLLRRLLGFVLILAMYFVFNLINFLYRLKTPYYNPSLYPPDDYVRGPLANDQGNNI